MCFLKTVDKIINWRCLSYRYRNKCEFTVGIDEETNLSTVGFRIGSYVNGTTGVGPIDDLVHIPPQMKTAVNVNI